MATALPLDGLDTGPIVNADRVNTALTQHAQLTKQWQALKEMQMCINDGKAAVMAVEGCDAPPLSIAKEAAMAALGARGVALAAQIKALGQQISAGQSLLT
jgi:hypothetical protein